MAIDPKIKMIIKIEGIVSATCNNECENVIKSSINEKAAIETLLQKVHDKIEPTFQSQEFQVIYGSVASSGQKFDGIEYAKASYQDSALYEVRDTVKAEWNREIQRKKLRQQTIQPKLGSEKRIFKSVTKFQNW